MTDFKTTPSKTSGKKAKKSTYEAEVPKVMDQISRDAMTLSVLRRQDPSISRIIGNFDQVTLYEANEKNVWEEKGVVGCLFIIEKNPQCNHTHTLSPTTTNTSPTTTNTSTTTTNTSTTTTSTTSISTSPSSPSYWILILNKKNRDNFFEALTPDVEFYQTGLYLLYRNSKSNVIRSIWFYATGKLQKFAAAAKGILSQLKKHSYHHNSDHDVPYQSPHHSNQFKDYDPHLLGNQSLPPLPSNTSQYDHLKSPPGLTSQFLDPSITHTAHVHSSSKHQNDMKANTSTSTADNSFNLIATSILKNSLNIPNNDYDSSNGNSAVNTLSQDAYAEPLNEEAILASLSVSTNNKPSVVDEFKPNNEEVNSKQMQPIAPSPSSDNQDFFNFFKKHNINVNMGTPQQKNTYPSVEDSPQSYTPSTQSRSSHLSATPRSLSTSNLSVMTSGDSVTNNRRPSPSKLPLLRPKELIVKTLNFDEKDDDDDDDDNDDNGDNDDNDDNGDDDDSDDDDDNSDNNALRGAKSSSKYKNTLPHQNKLKNSVVDNGNNSQGPRELVPPSDLIEALKYNHSHILKSDAVPNRINSKEELRIYLLNLLKEKDSPYLSALYRAFISHHSKKSGSHAQ